MAHIRFHDLRHTAATNMHQLTGDFYTVGKILGHSLKGVGIQLGISTNLEATTAQYVDVRLDRIRVVLQTYHNEIFPEKQLDTKKERTHRKDKSVKYALLLGMLAVYCEHDQFVSACCSGAEKSVQSCSKIAVKPGKVKL